MHEAMTRQDHKLETLMHLVTTLSKMHRSLHRPLAPLHAGPSSQGEQGGHRETSATSASNPSEQQLATKYNSNAASPANTLFTSQHNDELEKPLLVIKKVVEAVVWKSPTLGRVWYRGQ